MQVCPSSVPEQLAAVGVDMTVVVVVEVAHVQLTCAQSVKSTHGAVEVGYGSEGAHTAGTGLSASWPIQSGVRVRSISSPPAGLNSSEVTGVKAPFFTPGGVPIDADNVTDTGRVVPLAMLATVHVTVDPATGHADPPTVAAVTVSPVGTVYRNWTFVAVSGPRLIRSAVTGLATPPAVRVGWVTPTRNSSARGPGATTLMRDGCGGVKLAYEHVLPPT